MNDYIAAGTVGLIMTTGGLAAILGNDTLRPTGICVACLIIAIKAIPPIVSAMKRQLRANRIYRAIESTGQIDDMEALLDPNLDHTLFLEAAYRAGEGGLDTVPVLLYALEQTLDYQVPGWSERAEVLLQSIARIADEDALPALRKMNHVKGIGINQPLKRAIRIIEPRSRLLHPATGMMLDTTRLLRYACDAHPVDAPARLGELGHISG